MLREGTWWSGVLRDRTTVESLLRERVTWAETWRMSRGFQWRRQGRVKCVAEFQGGSVQFSHSVVSSFLRPHGLQHARPPCPSPTPRVYSNSCPLSWWYHPTISTFVVPFSSRLQSFPASGSFQINQLFTSGGQSTGVSASTSVLQKQHLKTVVRIWDNYSSKSLNESIAQSRHSTWCSY